MKYCKCYVCGKQFSIDDMIVVSDSHLYRQGSNNKARYKAFDKKRFCKSCYKHYWVVKDLYLLKTRKYLGGDR